MLCCGLYFNHSNDGNDNDETSERKHSGDGNLLLPVDPSSLKPIKLAKQKRHHYRGIFSYPCIE